MKNIKNIVVIFVSLVIMSCHDSNLKSAKTVIPILTNKTSNYKDIIARQEIIGLSNNNDSYMAKLDRVQVYDNYFVFRDNKDVIYVFDKNGHFVSNSKNVQGKGKGEYYICLAYSYNKYSHNIEIVVPDGIMIYDINFHFIGKNRFNDKKMESCMFNYIYEFGVDRHLLFCPQENTDGSKYYVYDSKQQKMILSKEYPIECKYITMQEQCISNNNFIAFPCMNYTFYEINTGDYEYNALITFNFGDKKLQEDEYNDKKTKDRIQSDLIKSTKSLPLRTFRSGNELAMLIKEGPMRKDFKTAFINIKTKECKILKHEDGNKKFPIMDFFADGIVYACVSAEELKSYVDESLLDAESKVTYEARSENSNYYVLKYYLKP